MGNHPVATSGHVLAERDAISLSPLGESVLRQQPIVPAILFAAILAMAATCEAHGNKDEDNHGVLAIAVFGDSLYGLNDADTAQFDATPAFILIAVVAEQ